MASAVTADKKKDVITLRGGELVIELSNDGRIVYLQGPPDTRALLSDKQKPTFFVLSCKGRNYQPTALRMEKAAGQLEISYGDTGVTASVQVRCEPTHVSFSLLEVRGAMPDTVTILRLPVNVKGLAGGTIGVIRDDQTAVGIQALNIHTHAGAGPAAWGGVLSSSAREDRGGIIGGGIALFACPAEEALQRIGQIELAEGLPHPILDGKWNKVSPTAHRPYLIIPYSVADMDKVLDLAKRGGFKYVYHPNPFDTWGHFILKKRQFPDGDKSLRECAEKAEKMGIRLGFHTLSGFITTNDPYVTPVPDPRLARIGSTIVAGDISASSTEIPVADAAPFQKPQTLAAVILGEELATYEGVVEGSPPKLIGVKRGAWGTAASPHKRGDDIGKLADYSYKTFYPGIANGMIDELTDRLVELVNFCGIHMVSFDGLEGLATYEGGGAYPCNRFVDQCHRGWKPEVISGASNSLHYNWHWHTRMNWGEITQSAKMDIDWYRYRRCEYYRANFLPAGMGWWRIGITSLDWEATRLEDVEYLLAKAAGNNATHALSTHVGILAKHGLAGRMFDLVREWDEARFGGAFTEEQCTRLRERGKDFQLRRSGHKQWELVPVTYGPFYWYCSGAGRERKPRELTFSSVGRPRPAQPFDIENPYEAQPISFELRCLPAYDYDHPQNIDLTPLNATKLVREAGLHREAPILQAIPDGEIAKQPALRLTATYKSSGKPSFVTRLCYELPEPLDLSKNRGLGLWVEGDGKGEMLFVEIQDGKMVRPYYVPIDFTGERYIELPLGEVCLKRYYDYEWNNWTGFSSWARTLKGFRYQRVMMVTVGYNAIPSNTEVSCRVAGIKALRELPPRVQKLSLIGAGQRLDFQPDLQAFQYLICEGSEHAQVCDPNYHNLRAVKPQGQFMLKPGASDAKISYECDGPAPWVRFQVKSIGS